MVPRTLLVKLPIALVVLSTVLTAASVDRQIADAESRRRGAESSLRELLGKAGADLDAARKVYSDAATSQNAWLDIVVQSLEQRTVTEPDVASASQKATVTLMEWVAVGGKALGLPPLSSSMEKGLRKSVEQDLMTIARDTWKSYANADVAKRDEAVATLNTRLRWKTAQEIETPRAF